MANVITVQFLEAIGAIILILLTKLVPELALQWEQLVNVIVAILIALLSAQLATRAVDSHYAVKAQELKFRYAGERSVLAKSEGTYAPNSSPIDHI